MPRARLLLVAAVVLGALLGFSTRAGARDDRSPQRLAPLPTLPSTTIPTNPSTPPSTTTSTIPPGIDVGHLGDQSGTANAPGGEVSVDPVDPTAANEVLRISSAEAQARRDAVQAELDGIDVAIETLTADLRAFAELSDDLVVVQRAVAGRVVDARRQATRRAVGAYMSGNAPEIEAAYGAADPNDVEERSTIVRAIMDADGDHVVRLLARRLAITSRLSRVLEQAEQTRAEVRAARDRRQLVEVRLDTADFALKVFEAGSEIVITGFVFPVADPHTFSSTFGAPRSGGRSHEGNDIFAPMGTALLAAERGVVTNMGTGSLGGTKLWVVGESGTEYYYAHLIAYADGVTDGTAVEAGDIIGYVGNTGNAISTPPHLHFEIHPGGGGAIDPYPLLHAVDQIDGAHVLPGLP